ncbi:MAG: DUF1203 domain-containing protein [Actinomycetota bacterium]
MTSIEFSSGIDTGELRDALRRGIDHGDNPIEPFVDAAGGWPLRCCLTNAEPGDRIAIIAWSPFPWQGPYAEVGPIVVHADDCPGTSASAELPTDLAERAMTLRPYGPDRRIAYHRVRHVGAGESTEAAVAAVLAEDDVAFVHGRNVTGGCYAFTAQRVEPVRP